MGKRTRKTHHFMCVTDQNTKTVLFAEIIEIKDVKITVRFSEQKKDRDKDVTASFLQQAGLHLAR